MSFSAAAATTKQVHVHMEVCKNGQCISRDYVSPKFHEFLLSRPASALTLTERLNAHIFPLQNQQAPTLVFSDLKQKPTKRTKAKRTKAKRTKAQKSKPTKRKPIKVTKK